MINYQDNQSNSHRDKQNGKRVRKQAGGTIVGFILGLIVGLGIAVGVAVVIQKIPVPFLNKLNKQEKIPELTAGQAADPNKPLYGNKEPAKEAAKDLASESGANPPAAKSVAEKPKTPDKLDNKAADGKPTDGKEAKAGPPKPDGADEKWIYYLQAGAFREQVDADSTKARLALAGFEASISERSAENGLLYRVRIGPFNQLELMNRARAKLSDNGMDVAVIRIAK
jgi:cell division protein FtsN